MREKIDRQAEMNVAGIEKAQSLENSLTKVARYPPPPCNAPPFPSCGYKAHLT